MESKELSPSCASAKSRKERNIRPIQGRGESRDGLESWEIRLYAGKDENGRDVYASETARGGIREARKLRADIQTRIANGTYLTRRQARETRQAEKEREAEQLSAVLTLADLLEKWLADIDEPGAAGTTYRRHCQIVRNDLIPNLGHLPLEEIGPLDIQDYYARARKSGRKDGNGGLSERTILHYHRLLKQVLKQAVAWGMLEHNPCDRVRAPSPVKKEMQIITAEQLLELLEICRGSKYYIPILLAATTGMRRGEICALHWDQVDFDKSTITVQYSLEEVGRALGLKSCKNDSSRRTIEIDEQTMSVLAEHKRRQDELWKRMGVVPGRRLVCTDEDGGFIRPKNLTTAFREIVNKHNLPAIRFHDLRHTHASLLIDAGVSIISVSARLGHSQTSTTMNTYGHRLPGSGKETAVVFAKVLDKATEKRDSEAG